MSPQFYQFARFASAVVLGMSIPTTILLPTWASFALLVAWAGFTRWIWLRLRPDSRLQFHPQLREKIWQP